MLRYTLSDFNKISLNTGVNELSDTTIKIINDLAKKVGAPNYSKTPMFKKKNNQKKYANKEDWGQIRNFKTTTLKKNQEGMEAKMDLLRINLNKLTTQNYDVITNEIFNFINNIIDKEKDKEETYKTLMEIGRSIFEIGCLNVFWSNVYAKLFSDLIQKFDIMEKICNENINKFKTVFDEIKCVELKNTNYDEFCKCNKNNAHRRGMCSFFINLMKTDIVKKDFIYDIIQKLLTIVNDNSTDIANVKINEEIVENISIMVLTGRNELSNNTRWEEIVRTIEFYSENSNDPGISKKIQFKCLDIIDELIE